MPDRRTLWFLLAVLAALTFIPVLQSGYTTTDDVYFAIGVAEGWRAPLLVDAQRSGRLQHLVANQLIVFAYGWGLYWVGKAIAIAAIVSNVAALFLLLRMVTRDARIALLAVIGFFAFIQNTWDHNLLTAYPFTLSCALTLLFGAMGAWWKALERSQPGSEPPPPGAWSVRRLRILSMTLYAVSLFGYESFMAYAVVFPAITIALTAGVWRDRLRAAVRTPHLVVLVVFVAAVVLFRVLVYDENGRNFNAAEQYELHLSPVATWKVLERYGASALPLHYLRIYRDLINDFYLGYGAFKPRWLEVFKVFNAAWMVKAAIVAFLVWVLGAARTTVRHKGLLLFLVAVFMLLTNLPIAVTMKYQAWVIQNYSRGYLTSYFVFIGVVILLAMVIDGIVGLAARRRSAWSRAAACLLAVTAFVVCYGTDFLNAHVSASQRQMYDRSRAVDAWIASPLFKDIPRDSVVFAPTLWDKYPSATHLFDDYWTRYALHYGFREQFDKPLARNRLNLIHVIDEETKPVVQSATAAGRLYYLKLVREPRSELTYVAFSRVPSIDPGHVFGSQEAWLLTHGRSDHLRVNGRVFGLSAECRARVLVNGTPSHGTFEGPFAVNVDHHWAAEPWLQTRLEAKGGLIDPETIAVSESAENVDNAVDVRYGEGFFPDEVAHRWAANEARLAILNRTDRSMLVDLRFDIRAPWAPAGSAHRVVVSAGSMKYEWPVDDTFRKHAVRVNVPAGTAVDVSFSTTAPRVDSAKDGRNLVLMFLPTFRAEEVGCESRDAG